VALVPDAQARRAGELLVPRPPERRRGGPQIVASQRENEAGCAAVPRPKPGARRSQAAAKGCVTEGPITTIRTSARRVGRSAGKGESGGGRLERLRGPDGSRSCPDLLSRRDGRRRGASRSFVADVHVTPIERSVCGVRRKNDRARKDDPLVVSAHRGLTTAFTFTGRAGGWPLASMGSRGTFWHREVRTSFQSAKNAVVRRSRVEA